MAVIPPQTLTGFLSKQGHEVRNWKRRFFVLDSGRISYYEKASGKDEPPYGCHIKGSMTLDNVQIEFDDEESEVTDTHPNRIYLIDGVTGVDLLISASDFEQCVLWRSLLIKHIEFANKYPAEIISAEDAAGGTTKRRWSLFAKFKPGSSAAVPSGAMTKERSDSDSSPSLSSSVRSGSESPGGESSCRKESSRRVSMAGRIDISTTVSGKGLHTSETAKVQLVPEFTNPGAPRHFICMKVDRPTGCNVLASADTDASILQRLPTAAIVRVIGRIVQSDGKDFYRLPRGFIAARSDNNQRILKFCSLGNPVEVRVLKMSLSHVDDSSFFGLIEGETFRTDFVLEVLYGGEGRDTVLRLVRRFHELEVLQRALKRIHDKWEWLHVPDGELGFPVVTDGCHEMVEDPELSTRLVDAMSLWLSKVVRNVGESSCKELRHFFIPREKDAVLMDHELVAENGLNGAWGLTLV